MYIQYRSHWFPQPDTNNGEISLYPFFIQDTRYSKKGRCFIIYNISDTFGHSNLKNKSQQTTFHPSVFPFFPER